MELGRPWVVGVMAVGVAAAMAAGVLLWLMMTQPVTAAGLFGGGL
ncbi:MAG TPA: hypothetical protein VMM93_02555 [Vicinamibacterales bacterium]|nr:hypothetical protein [Vicinamibacterales bacterium]